VETVWRYLTGAGLLCLLALPAPAQKVSSPGDAVEVKVEPGRLKRLTAESFAAGKSIKWVVASEAVDLIPSESGRWAIFSAPTSGTYFVFTYSATDKGEPTDPVVYRIVVGKPAPPPPPPPDPDDPVVKDPLFQKLLPVYAADVTPGKADKAKQLAAVYRNAGSVTLNDPSITTLGRFYEVVSVASKQLVPPPALDVVRNAVAADHKAVLGERYDAPLDANAKAKVAAQFARVAAILERLAS
jgi:hypothetical protein